MRTGAAGGARAPAREGLARAGQARRGARLRWQGERARAQRRQRQRRGAGEALDENEDMPKAFVHSYCALDYARAVDVASLRAHRLRRRLKEAVQKKCDPAMLVRGSH